MKSDEIVTIYMTFADRAEAERIGHALVAEKLVACVNILSPVTAIYPWDGAIQQEQEVAALAKSTAARFDAVAARVTELHSYDVPCIVAWPVAGIAGPYAQWVAQAIG
ncbi:MAG TPA: divalent-cation tolerance protein CutA [Alphaproteobacteria bacterium]